MRKTSFDLTLSPLLLALISVGAMLFALGILAEAQRTKNVPRLGYLALGAGGPGVETFRQGLRELGYVEGKDIIIEYRWAEGKFERLSELAAELVRLKVDIIVTGGGGGPVTLAAKNATTTIPIVAAVIAGDPVASGLVASFARPGGNITGFSNLAPELAWRRLELVKETFPKITLVAFLWNPSISDPSAPGTSRIEETHAAAQASGIGILSLEVRSSDELASALESAVRERAGALMVPAYMIGRTYRRQITEFSIKRRLPVSCDTGLNVEEGVCLMAYGPNITENYRRAATYVDKILKGTKPANLPVEAPIKFELVINLKTAKQIGLTIPPNVLARADRVIR
jgi:putative ABC transport system substrate-binding protein